MQTALPCELQELFDALQDLRFSLLIEAADRDGILAVEVLRASTESRLVLLDARRYLGLLGDRLSSEGAVAEAMDNYSGGVLVVTGIDQTLAINALQQNEDNAIALGLHQLLLSLERQTKRHPHAVLFSAIASANSLDKAALGLFVRTRAIAVPTPSSVDAFLRFLLQHMYGSACTADQTALQSVVACLRESCEDRSISYCCGLIEAALLNAHSRTSSDTVSASHMIAWPGTQLERIDVDKGVEQDLLATTGKNARTSNVAPTLWADIGGLDSVREEILQALQLPLSHPEAFRLGTRGRGILLYGPPGTGKTLVARAVATECALAFMSVKGPELLDMYVGESERNLRNVFADARARQPCVLFFDELDSLVPCRGRSGDAGGVLDRVVSQFMVEMDAVAALSDKPGEQGVFVIAATNRPDLLDPAMLRAGRFDKKIFLGACKSIEGRVSILRAQTRKLTLSSDVDLREVAALLPDSVTGADVGAVTSSAFAIALEGKFSSLEQACPAFNGGGDSEERHAALASFVNAQSEEELAVLVTMRDLVEAARRLVPSVSAADHRRYEELRVAYET